MKFLKIISLIFIIMLSACQTTPQEKIVEKTKHVLIKPDISMVSDCSVTKPPSKQEYMAKTHSDKEETLYIYILELLEDMSNCNNKLHSVRAWFIEQENLYSKEDKK